MSDPVLTVSMPTYRKPMPMVREAVECVLANDAPLRLVIVSDACPLWDGLPDITDERVIRYELPENHGAFHASAVVLHAAKTPFWALHDSDDLTPPGRYDLLLSEIGDADAIVTPVTQHNLDGTVVDKPVKPVRRGHGRSRHVAYSPAHIYRTQLLREVGMPADIRVSLDSSMASLYWHRYSVKVAEGPPYIIRKTEGSLTMNPDTGHGSPYRDAVRRDVRARFREAVRTGAAMRGAKPDLAHVEALRALL